MLFIAICGLAFAAVSTALAFHFTRRRLAADWKSAGPKPISDALSRRNRTLLLALVGLLAVVAFLEALVPDFAYGIQDLQITVSRGVPGWSLVRVGYGSISWMLYLAVFAGVCAGLLGGTIAALRRHRDLDRVRLLHLV